MSVEHIKSTSVTNREASPPVANTAGAGAAGRLHSINDYVTAPASASADSTLRVVRVPSNCKVKRVILESEAQAAGKFDVGVYYPITGHTGVADLAANAIDQNLFAIDVDCASAVAPLDVTNYGSSAYTLGKRNQPLWQAAGLSSDPGGYFDIALTVHTTAITTGTGKTGLLVDSVA